MKNHQKFFHPRWYIIEKQLYESYLKAKNIQKILEAREALRIEKNYLKVTNLINKSKNGKAESN